MNRVMCYFCPNFKELFMYLRLCGADQLPEILEIFNHAIRTSTALYDYSERTMGDMENWYADKQAHNHPVMGVFDEDGTLMGLLPMVCSECVRPINIQWSIRCMYILKNVEMGLGKCCSRKLFVWPSVRIIM